MTDFAWAITADIINSKGEPVDRLSLSGFKTWADARDMVYKYLLPEQEFSRVVTRPVAATP